MRIQPWTESQLMSRENDFESITRAAVYATVRKVNAQLAKEVLTSATEPAPAPPAAQLSDAAYLALEGDVVATWTDHVDASLFPFLTNTFTDSAERVVAALGGDEPTLTNTYASEFLQYAYNRMVGVSQVIWENIREQLSQGFEDGESIPQIADRLKTVAGLSTPRALVTARTEIISAANAGSYLQMLSAGFDDTEVTKVWLATEDSRTRISHRHAEDQGVPLSDEFSIDIYNGDVKTGTEGLEFPGDPTGSPGNVINCRCSLAFDFSEDEDEVVTAAADGFSEVKHPRDKDGKFKKKGAPDLYVPRPLGGVDAKTGKALVPGKPTKLRVQLLYNTKFEDGAIMAVRKDSGERIVWDGKNEKIKRQKLVDGKYQTTEELTRGKAYAQWKDEDGWSIPDAATLNPAAKADAATPATLDAGKPVKLRVQLIYQTPFGNGDVVAVNPGTGERIHWDESKKRMILTSADGSTKEYTRGALYKEKKDETGWHLPANGGPAPAAVSEPDDEGDTDVPDATPDNTPAVNVSPEPSQDVLPAQSPSPFQTVQKIGTKDEWLASLDSMKTALNDPDVPAGTMLFEQGGISIEKVTEDVSLMKIDGVSDTKHLYTDDLNPNTFINSALILKAKNKPTPFTKSAKPKAASLPPPTPAKPKNVPVSDDDVDGIKDDFDSSFIGDVLFENDKVTIEKANEDDVSLNMKDDLGNFQTHPAADLTAEHVNDFIELNETPPAPTAPAAPVPGAISEHQATNIKNAALSPAIPTLTIIYQDDDIEIMKGNGVIAAWSKTDASVASEPLPIAAISAGSLQHLKDQIDSQMAAKGGGSTITPSVPASVANVATPNVSVTGKTLTPSVKPSKPMKMNAGTLTGKKSTQYTDGQIVGYHPETEAGAGDELLVWNAKTKKYDVYTRPAGSSEDWQKSYSYNKQAALKNLGPDDGWFTPPAGLASPAGSAAPTINGAPSTPSVNVAPTTGAKPLTFTTIQLNAAADHKIAALSDGDVKDIYTFFRQKNPGNSYDVVRLSSPGEEVLEAVLRAQQKHQAANPGQSLNMLEIIKAVDIQAAKDAGAPNNNLFEKKLVDWLGTPEGKKSGPQVMHEFRLSPAEKAQIVADKKAAEKAALDAKLKDFHAITATLSKPETTSTTFNTQTTASAQAVQDAMLAATPWTGAQKSALKKYTGSYYYTLNGMLRGSIAPTDQTLKDAKETQKGMRPLGADMLLFRGTGPVAGVLPGNIDEYKNLIGKTFVEPGFSSTSITNPFGGQIKLEIEAPKGTPAAYLRSISNYTNENEVLLAAGTKFEMISAVQDGYKIVVRVRVVP